VGDEEVFKELFPVTLSNICYRINLREQGTNNFSMTWVPVFISRVAQYPTPVQTSEGIYVIAETMIVLNGYY
jgi:hypothetical protein